MKITFISDTHGHEPNLPGGDILFHCGDLSEYGFKSEVMRAMLYLSDQLDKYKYVVFIPGNHDLWIQKHVDTFKDACLNAGIIGLINESVTLDGLNIWGSPATLEYHNWAFNYTPNQINKIWEKIPSNTDIVITHSPPKDILDKNVQGKHLGCPDLLEKIKEINPKIHAFGHIHENAGQIQIGNTLFINAATIVVNVDI